MSRFVPALSRILLIMGILLILSGLGWGLWMRINAPPPPEITDAGAVVLAITAPVRMATSSPEPTDPPPTPEPTETALPSASTEEMGASESESPSSLPTPTPTKALPGPTSTRRPTPSPSPSPTPVPPEPQPPIRVAAAAIGLDAPVVPMTWQIVDDDGTMVSRWVVPSDAAGWHVNSAMPGQQENVVLSGHHNIEGKVFRYVVDLEPGDRVALTTAEAVYEYIVAEKYILKEAGMPLKVRQKNAQWIMPTGDERLTLVTCWPYEWPGNSHRVIVVARPPEYFEGLVEEALGGPAR
jgi:sortase A